MRLLLALFSVCWWLLGVAQQPSLLERAGQEVSRVVERTLPAIVTVEARFGGRLVRSSGFVIDRQALWCARRRACGRSHRFRCTCLKASLYAPAWSAWTTSRASRCYAQK